MNRAALLLRLPRLPRLLLVSADVAATPGACGDETDAVVIPVASPGVQHGGHLFRTDTVVLRAFFRSLNLLSAPDAMTSTRRCPRWAWARFGAASVAPARPNRVRRFISPPPVTLLLRAAPPRRPTWSRSPPSSGAWAR